MSKLKKSLCVAAAALVAVATVPNVNMGVQTASAAVVVANTQKHNSKLSVSPTVITKMEKAEQLDEYAVASYMPSTLIVDVDENLNVLSSDGAEISTLDAVYQKFKRKIVLVVNVSTTQAGDAFADYVEEKAIEDISVMSEDSAIVSYVKEKQPRIRAVVDYSSKDLGNSISDEVLETHRVGANVMVLSQSQSDYESVFYAQGMLTTVWTVADESTEFCIASCISTGTYGIIASDYALCYATYDKYETGSLPRSFYNIAHRTLPYSYPENSLEGLKAAVEGGATHVEIDIKVTKDNQLLVMHDNDLGRTTNGTGNVEDMTLAEIRQYKLTKNTAGAEMDAVEIPTLREMFEHVKTQNVILVVEIKTEKTNCCDLLKALMDEYQIYDKVVVITYSKNQLKVMRKKLPQVPLASLNSFVYPDFSIGSLGDWAEVNAVPNCSFDYDTLANRNYKSRGYMAYAYTYDTALAAIGVAGKGCTGITNNRADGVGEYVKRIYAENAQLQSGTDITTAKFQATIERYNGETEQVDAKVAFYEETENGYYVILQYAGKDYKLYSQAIEVTVKENTDVTPPTSSETPNNSSESTGDQQGSATQSNQNQAVGCGASAGAGLLGCVMFVAFVLSKKKYER